jgi:hypothetical protein
VAHSGQKERLALTFTMASREGAERPPQESHAITLRRGSSSFTDQLIWEKLARRVLFFYSGLA